MLLSSTQDEFRAAAAERGKQLEILTILWGFAEAALALTSAAQQGSISLTGFGLDSVIEVLSAMALLWRMSHEMDHHRRHRAERISLQFAGYCLIALGAFVFVESVIQLRTGRSAPVGKLGLAVTTAALIFMPLLSRAKARVGIALGSFAMMTDAKQTNFCMYQAAIVLAGLLVERLFHIGWADGLAALILVPFLIRAGIMALRGENCCSH